MISTGDELVDIHKTIKQYQTRLSNSYAVQALLNQSQLGDVEIFHLRDNQKLMLQSYQEYFREIRCFDLKRGSVHGGI